jgi:hypothetical protein
VAKQFALNFNGVKQNLVHLSLKLQEQSISTSTEIPIQGENGSKLCL